MMRCQVLRDSVAACSCEALGESVEQMTARVQSGAQMLALTACEVL